MIEALNQVKGEQHKDSTPLQYRGHRLELLVDLAMEIQTPETLAERQRTGFQRDRARLIGSRPLGYGEMLDYYTDLIGTTPEEADQFERKEVEEFRKFIGFPHDYPVELVAGVPDTICGCAFMGNHCRERASRRVPDQTTGAVDQLFLEVFAEEAKKLGREEGKHFTRGRKIATYSDGSSEALLSLSTTLGTLRRVLLESPRDWEAIAPDPV